MGHAQDGVIPERRSSDLHSEREPVLAEAIAHGDGGPAGDVKDIVDIRLAPELDALILVESRGRTGCGGKQRVAVSVERLHLLKHDAALPLRLHIIGALENARWKHFAQELGAKIG